MPNIKSAKKRVLVIEKKTEENKAIKSRIATFAKKFKAAVAEGNTENATALYNEVVALMDKAACDNVIHKNYANRKKAHFCKMLDNLKKAN
ncbi:MAG: 30S ribosomal protein S20 [Clostridiales bacterium]|nr:30S ribosomal protein S20 [Clostridiales bacterium]